MSSKKDAILIEFILKTQCLAYKNSSEVCMFCGGGRTYDKHLNWKPIHFPNCLYARAEEIVLAQVSQ